MGELDFIATSQVSGLQSRILLLYGPLQLHDTVLQASLVFRKVPFGLLVFFQLPFQINNHNIPLQKVLDEGPVRVLFILCFPRPDSLHKSASPSIIPRYMHQSSWSGLPRRPACHEQRVHVMLRHRDMAQVIQDERQLVGAGGPDAPKDLREFRPDPAAKGTALANARGKTVLHQVQHHGECNTARRDTIYRGRLA